LHIINGVPGISYYDITNGNLKYVRATDINGKYWTSPAPLIVDQIGNVGKYSSLHLVNGFPAISYYDESLKSLKFVRAHYSYTLNYIAIE
jgi:hypothetical protein